MTRSRTRKVLLVSILLAMGGGGAARAAKVEDLKVRKVNEHKREVAVVASATINASAGEIDKLQKCVARIDWPLRRSGDPGKIFRAFRWSPKELNFLNTCNLQTCKYNFPKPMVRRLMAAPGIEQKKAVYFKLMHEMALGANKRRKSFRILTRDVYDEPCTGHGAFRWLVNGKPKPHSQMSWRKLGGSKRMHPTTNMFHVYSWKVGQTRCVGRSMLWSDHYYHDHLELFQITPKGPEQLAVRFHVRSRFDVLDTWWKQRTYKWEIRKVTARVAARFLYQWVHRCLK